MENKIEDSNMLEMVKAIYKKTLGYQLERYEVTGSGVKHYHSDAFLDEHPERRETPEYTEDEELEALDYIKKRLKEIRQ